jgi:hypothetical protein
MAQTRPTGISIRRRYRVVQCIQTTTLYIRGLNLLLLLRNLSTERRVGAIADRFVVRAWRETPQNPEGSVGS